jgi:hypothetical protein
MEVHSIISCTVTSCINLTVFVEQFVSPDRDSACPESPETRSKKQRLDSDSGLSVEAEIDECLSSCSEEEESDCEYYYRYGSSRIRCHIRDKCAKTLAEWERELKTHLNSAQDEDAEAEGSPDTYPFEHHDSTEPASDGIQEIDSDLEDALQESCLPPGGTNEFKHRQHVRDVFCARSLALAFLMGFHPRLGAASLVARLDANTVDLILDAVHPDVRNEDSALDALLDFRDTLAADEARVLKSMEEEEARCWDGDCEGSEAGSEEEGADLSAAEMEDPADADLDDGRQISPMLPQGAILSDAADPAASTTATAASAAAAAAAAAIGLRSKFDGRAAEEAARSPAQRERGGARAELGGRADAEPAELGIDAEGEEEEPEEAEEGEGER